MTSNRPLKVLLVPSGPQRIASARIRAYQYVKPLQDAGLICRVFPAMSEMSGRFRVQSPKMARLAKLAYYTLVIADRYSRLVPLLFLAATHDVIYLQRTTFPPGFPKLLAAINPRIIFDFDDAIHLRDPDDRESGWLARLKERSKSRALPAILAVSRCAIVEHHILEAYARQHCSRVELIAGPIDTEKFAPAETCTRSAGKPIVIGWMGTPLTSNYLPIAAGALARLAARHSIEVHLIGSGPIEMDGVPLRIFPWAEHEETMRLGGFDIGIMPMPDTEWTRGKLGLKMLLYMSSGIPAVVSDTPINASIIAHGVNGFIAADDQWEPTLETLVTDASLRRSVGIAGRRTVEEKFALAPASQFLIGIMRDVTRGAAAS